MSNNIYFVYEHWRPDKDVCFYVGKGKGRRAIEMRVSRNKYHRNVQAKLARLGMCAEVRMVANGLTESRAFEIERERIAFWRTIGIKLTNISAGGDGPSGIRRTDAEKARISREKTGNTYRLGQKASEATKAKLRISGRAALPLFQQYAHLGPKAIARAVVCVDDGCLFESASAAARHYGIAKSAVIELCLGKRYRKTVGGLVFRYLETE